MRRFESLTPAQRACLVLTISVLSTRIVLSSRHIRLAAFQLVAPVHDHFFPALFRDPWVLLLACFLPVVSEIIAIRYRTPSALRRAAVVEIIGTALLLLHQATYFYATWVIVFWAAVFMLWVSRNESNEERLRASGPFLAQALIAFMFFGGAAGKWTIEFWSGNAFQPFFLSSNLYKLMVMIHGPLSPEQIQVALSCFSRAVVVTESLLATLIFFPAKSASLIAIAAAIGFWLLSFDLLEVSWPLVGIALAGLALSGRPELAMGNKRLDPNTSDAADLGNEAT